MNHLKALKLHLFLFKEFSLHVCTFFFHLLRAFSCRYLAPLLHLVCLLLDEFDQINNLDCVSSFTSLKHIQRRDASSFYLLVTAKSPLPLSVKLLSCVCHGCLLRSAGRDIQWTIWLDFLPYKSLAVAMATLFTLHCRFSLLHRRDISWNIKGRVQPPSHSSYVDAGWLVSLSPSPLRSLICVLSPFEEQKRCRFKDNGRWRFSFATFCLYSVVNQLL